MKKQTSKGATLITVPAQSTSHTRNRSVNLTSGGGDQSVTGNQSTARQKNQPQQASATKGQQPPSRQNAHATMQHPRNYNSIGPGYHGGRNQKVTTTGGPTGSRLQPSSSKTKNSMKGLDNSSASGKNIKNVSLNKRLVMATDPGHGMLNNTIDFMQLGLHDLNNTALLQQHLNQQFAGNRSMIDQGRAQPKTTTNRWSKHMKAFSMIPNSVDMSTGIQLNQMPFSGRTPAAEKFLNQPLPQKLMNLNQLNTTQPIPHISEINTPIDYQGLDSIGDGTTYNIAQLLSPKDLGYAQVRWPNQTSITQAEIAALTASGNYQYQPTPFTGAPIQYSSKGSGLNQTGRSYSHCSRREIQSNSSGIAINSAQTKTAIPEAQMLESEEHFEAGKVFLQEKKYKEAVKMFSKSLALNKTCYDALFYRAVSNLDSGQPQLAITDLNDLIEQCPDYRKTMFIILSIAYRRVNDYPGAQRALSKALGKYPRYVEAFIARGQIYIFEKKWDKALSDFRQVIQLQPANGLGYLGQGDSFKGVGNFNNALASFTKAIDTDQKTVSQGLMKRGLLLLQMKMNDQALQDFTRLTELVQETKQPPPALSKAFYYKAKALKKINNLSDSILYFEQVIRANDDNHLASQALYEIAKIKIQQKDFYEAYYNLKRATHFKLKQRKLVNYKMFTEGVIFLMKRKTKTGVKLISSLIERMKPEPNAPRDAPPDYIYNLVYLYRAYGLFVTEEYEDSLKDYLKANQIKKLNASAQFNMTLCQGLKALNAAEYENAISFFTKASQKMAEHRDPFLLRAIAIVRFAMHMPIKPATKTKMLKDAKRDLNKALANSPKDYQVLYLRGLLNFTLNFFFDAITDLETVIEKAEEANAKHYLARGRCYACLSMFKEAITDLSIAINLNKDLLEAYLNRGKCAYLIGDTGLAFMDFQKLIVIEPKNPMVHIYAGNLLMTTGSYEDATKAFTNADNIEKSSLALYQRGRCNVALNSMTDALSDLEKVIEQAPTDKVAIADMDCLNALKSASGGSSTIQLHVTEAPPIQQDPDEPQNVPLTQVMMIHEKSVYTKSATALSKLINQASNENLAKIMHDSSVQHMHSQMIPSANRTKTDKIRAIRRRKEQDRFMKEGKEKRNDLRFRVQQSEEPDEDYEDISELDAEELARLNKQLEAGSNATQGADISDNEADNKDAEEANYYKENIFNKEDYYLYRGIIQIYSGDYDKALSDLEQSSSIMHANKVLYPKNNQHDEAETDDQASHASSQTDLSDVGLCSLNIHEYSFNQVVCLVMQKKFSSALDKLDYMLSTIPKKYVNQLWLIRGAVHQALGNIPQAKKDYQRANKFDQENAAKFLEMKQNVYLPVFPQQQRLCSSFAFLKTPLAAGSGSIYLRPSFSFPFIKPPNMIPCVDNAVLDYFTSKAVPLKPEAPWIKKCSYGIKFTEEIYITDDDHENTPDEDKEYNKRRQRQERGDLDEELSARAYSEIVMLKKNIFAETKEVRQRIEAAELLQLFKEQYPEAEIDLDPADLDEEQLMEIKQALQIEHEGPAPFNKKDDIKMLKEQIQEVTGKKPKPPGRNVATKNVKTQQEAPKKQSMQIADEDEFADGSDVVEEDGLDQQVEDADAEIDDLAHETDDSDQKDFADIRRSLRQ